MLKYNIQRLIKIRGIEKPAIHLSKFGIDYQAAIRLSRNKTKAILPEVMEKLCYAFNCTPNDLYEWTPSTKEEDNASNPLKRLKRDDSIDLRSKHLDIPLDKLEEYVNSINEVKNKIIKGE